MGQRPSWEEYALRLCDVVKLRSEDPYFQVGTVILRHDNSIASVGYNGPPSGVDIDWSDRDSRRPFIVHSEVNALRYCLPGEGKLLACSISPCSNCLAQIAAYGIKRVVFRDIYKRDELAFEIAKKFGIEMIQIN